MHFAVAYEPFLIMQPESFHNCIADGFCVVCFQCRGGVLVVEVAVEQLLALERRGVGDPVDGLQDRVDLQLVRGLLLGGDAGFIRGRGDERLQFDQKVRDLLKAAFGDDDVPIAVSAS